MSDLIRFADCMMDGDAEALNRSRTARRQALAFSAAFEVMVIATIALATLFTSSVLPPVVFVMPLPPFHGVARVEVVQARSSDTVQPSIIHPIAAPDLRIRPVLARSIQTGDSGPFDPNFVTGDIGVPISVIPVGSDAGPAISSPQPNTNFRKPLSVSGGVMEASLIQKMQPTYPAIAKAMRLSGQVKLLAIIRADGSVGEMTVLSGNPILVLAAKSAVAEWRYKPTLLNGQPVEVETTITVNFILQ